MAFQTTLRHFRANTSRLLPRYNHPSSTSISSYPRVVLASTNTITTTPTVARPYSHPLVYDVAFSFRDFDSESRFLLDAFSHHSSSSSSSLTLTSTLEIGCGPARHTAALLQQHPQLTRCYGLDTSLDMLAYAREQLTYNNSNKAIKVSFIQADMCAPQGFLSTELPVESIQLATILLGTLGHCLDNASAQQCFQNIAAALQPGGLLIIELPHPTDLFSGTYYYADSIKNYREQQGQVSGDNTGEDGDGALEEDEDEDVVDLDEEEEEDDDSYVKCWEIENPNNPEERVYVEWGREGDDFEVDRQILHRTVGLSLYRGEDLVSSEVEVVPQKCFTLQEVELLGRGAGLEVCGVYGELSMEVVGLLSEGAHRMVVCLKKERGEVS